MTLTLKPLSNRVLVRPDLTVEKTAGGILIPESAKEKPQRGTVVAAGDGRVGDSGALVPMSVRVGEAVLYGKYAGTAVEVDGVEHLLMADTDLLAIL